MVISSSNYRKIYFFLIIISLITFLFYLFKKNFNFKKNEYLRTNCPNSSYAIAYFGQSNAANSVNRINKSNIPDNLYQYNFKDNNCYEYKEPLIGASGKKGNTITPFAISLANSMEENILIVPYGISGTLIESWSTGNKRLLKKNLLGNLKNRKINVDLFLFHQGESDAAVVRNLSKKSEKLQYSRKYLKNLLKIIDQTRIYFPDSHFGLSLVSKCFNSQNNYYITNSQKEATKLRPLVFISADSDAIFGRKYRYDNCHFNLKGAEKLSKQYTDSLIENIIKY